MAKWRVVLVVVTMALAVVGAAGATNDFTWKGPVATDPVGAPAYHKVPAN
jgi:hypothetical protein